MLSDVAEPPLSSLEFERHPGLLLLYAERLAANDRRAWRPPQNGPGWDYYELVSDERVVGNPVRPSSLRAQEKGLTLDDAVDRLRREVVEPLKRRFVDRDEIVDLIALARDRGRAPDAARAAGNGQVGLIRQFAGAVRGKYFEYLLTRFSEPNEVFGPIDLVRLREGTVATVTSGMLPEAEFIFLDELFNANSAILNNLLTVLNERIYRRGAEVHRLPLLSLFAASNHLPEDESLRALFDRFLLRSHVENLKREELPRLLAQPAGSSSGAVRSSRRFRPKTCVHSRGGFMRLKFERSPIDTPQWCRRCATWASLFPTGGS